MIWFTADEHYGHAKIIEYCKRPFSSVEEMDAEMISSFNLVVGKDDKTYHLGDFTLNGNPEEVYKKYINNLNGEHVFLKGSHDYWLKKSYARMLVENFGTCHIVMCHYAMRVWHLSHYNSWHLYGHSHGSLPGQGKSMDVGVDTHDFSPYSLESIGKIMSQLPNNFNLVKKG